MSRARPGTRSSHWNGRCWRFVPAAGPDGSGEVIGLLGGYARNAPRPDHLGGDRDVGTHSWRVAPVCRGGRGDQPSLAAWAAIADLRFAAWFLWMTPAEAALSSCREATCAYSVALSASPAAAASRNRRTAVRREDFAALL